MKRRSVRYGQQLSIGECSCCPQCTCPEQPYDCPKGRALVQAILDRKSAQGDYLFGMPDTAELSRAVYVLARPHERTVGELTGQEPALLDLLEVAIKTDTSGASGNGGGSTRAGGPVDVNALSIWQGIHQVVAEFWPGKGQLQYAHMRLIERLTWWVSTVAGTDDEVYLTDLCNIWTTKIRELLEPPKRVPVRGGQCPRCKEFQVLGTDLDGNRVYQPCLLAHMSEEPLRIECLACGGTWYSLDLLKLEVDVILGDAPGTLVTSE